MTLLEGEWRSLTKQCQLLIFYLPFMNPKPPPFLSKQVSSSQRFYFRIPSSKSAGLSVYCGGLENSLPCYVDDRKTFPYFSVELVVAGKGTLTLNSQHYALGAGSVFVYGPKIPHRIASLPESPLVKYFVTMSGHATEKLLHELQLSPGTFLSVEALSEVRDIVDTLVSEGSKGRRHSHRICNLLCESLLLKIAENRVHHSDKLSEGYLTYLRCREILATEYLKLSNLAEFAKRCGISSPYLCRLYQAYDHQTPYHHLQRLRMTHAANLLIHPGTLVKDVADTLGMQDVYHFSRSFKRVHGVSPRVHKNIASGRSLNSKTPDSSEVV
jgi:AraC-like DNA-binding protein